jgi:hypothetical protein
MEQPPPLPPDQPPLPPHHAPTLSYQQPGAMRPAPQDPGGLSFLLQFLIGALGGAAVSAVAWIAGWKFINGNAGVVVFIVPGVKLVAGITLLCLPRWRGLGAGIMVSIALGFLIFFGTCVAHLNG